MTHAACLVVGFLAGIIFAFGLIGLLITADFSKEPPTKDEWKLM